MSKYIAVNGNNGNRSVYHTNQSCDRIKSKKTRQASENEIAWHNMTECEWCKHGTKAALEND